MTNDQAQIVCTNCGAPMVSRSCKLRCRSCGYFEDCSDTGLPVYSMPIEKVGYADQKPPPLGRFQVPGRTSK